MEFGRIIEVIVQRRDIRTDAGLLLDVLLQLGRRYRFSAARTLPEVTVDLALRQQVLRQTCDLHNLSTTTTVLDIYHEPHTPSAGALSDLRSQPPVKNNHTTSVRLCACLYQVNSVENDPSMGASYPHVGDPFLEFKDQY